MERVYFSVNKFMNYIHDNKLFEQYCQPKTIYIWFESDETFINKFNQLVIKPIAISLRSSDKSITMTHQTVINAFDNKQPFISVSKNKNRSIPKNGELSFLSINMTPKEFEGKKFYPSKISFTTNKTVVKNILDKKIYEDEEEDFGTDITEFI